MFSQLTFLPLVFFVILKDANSEYFQTQILEARQLYPFRAYKDVQIFHYTVPPQVSQATFQYKANGSFHCSPKPIAVYLQYGSYPVMSPRNASFPESFIIKRLSLRYITLLTDLVPVSLNVSNPLPGSWYAAAFLLESTERIAQKGLFTPCSGWLTTLVKLNISNSVKTLLSESNSSEEVSSNQMYRFFSDGNTWSCEVKLKDCRHTGPNSDCPVLIRARPSGLPSHEEKDFINCSLSNSCILKFVPAVNDWNYISIQTLLSTKINFQLEVKTEVCKRQSLSVNGSFSTDFMNISAEDTEFNSIDISDCWPNIPLVRISLSTNLAFEYNLPPDDDESYPLILNITNNSPTYTSFEVLPTVDIGGTLIIELAISPFMNLSLSNISVVSCLAYGVRPNSEDEAFCESGIELSVNTSSWDNRLTTALIPFPEAGLWYFSLMPHCFVSEINDTMNITTIVPCEMSYTSVFLRIRSAPCVLGQCGEYGSCFQYVSGGFIFSTCNCIAGWKGWGCTDGTAAHTDVELLMDVLLLTLSNLLFIPAIILGIYRKYFTEAFVYFTTMVFSAFYHACDAEVYSYCLMRLNVLQFCDFYSAILSIWVTLVAMAGLPTAVQSIVHMAGAIGVALGVEYDRTGLWVIVMPAGVGLLILFTSWVSRCYKTGMCYPSKKIWICGLLPGILLALCGLVIYAFFETKDNYPYVHSAWHGTIALSVLFLLPKRQIEDKGTPEPLSTSSYIRVGDVSSNVVSVPNCTAYDHLLTPTP